MGISIAIEGNDGAGKSTLIKLLKKYYKAKKIKILVVRYNMSYVTLKAIKEGKKRFFSAETNTLLHYLSIKDQIERFIYNYKKVDLIIWDRYIYSVCARAMARNVNLETTNFILKNTPSLDHTILLDITSEQSLYRLGEENISFWEAGQDIYKKMSKVEAFKFFQSDVKKNLITLITETRDYSIFDAFQERSIIFENCIKIINSKLKHN